MGWLADTAPMLDSYSTIIFINKNKDKHQNGRHRGAIRDVRGNRLPYDNVRITDLLHYYYGKKDK